MKYILNYGLTYYEDGIKKDDLFLCKKTLIKTYIDMLDSGRNISSLQCFQWEGKRNPKLVWITDNVNEFLAR